MSLVVVSHINVFFSFFLIRTHYAWHPEDLAVKLSLETQIWINVSSVG